MKNRKDSGHIHVFGLFIVLVAFIAMYLVWRWDKRLIYLHDELNLLDRKIENLDTKVRFLELQTQAHQAPLTLPTPTPGVK